MNGFEYTGALGALGIMALEKQIGVGVFSIGGKLGVEVTFTTLQLAAQKHNPRLDAEKFSTDFETEVGKNGIGSLASKAMEIIKDSGALGVEKEEKKSE
jgi:hypothetical protein